MLDFAVAQQSLHLAAKRVQNALLFGFSNAQFISLGVSGALRAPRARCARFFLSPPPSFSLLFPLFLSFPPLFSFFFPLAKTQKKCHILELELEFISTWLTRADAYLTVATTH